VDTLLDTLAEPGCGHLWPAGDSPYPDGWAHRAVTTLQRAAGAARQAMGHDHEQDLNLILPALADILDDLAAIADGLTPYCGDFCDRSEARLGTVTGTRTPPGTPPPPRPPSARWPPRPPPHPPPTRRRPPRSPNRPPGCGCAYHTHPPRPTATPATTRSPHPPADLPSKQHSARS